MILYLDTSSLVKLYVEETGSDAIQRIKEKARIVVTSKIAYAEARAAFARKHKEGLLPLLELKKIISDFNLDWEKYVVIEITNSLIFNAGNLAEKYFLRGFDSIHLASAIFFKTNINAEIYFSSWDSQLNVVAKK